MEPHPGITGRNLLEGGSSWIYSESLLGQRSLGLSPLYSHTDKEGRFIKGGFDRFYPSKGDDVLVDGMATKSVSHRLEQLQAVIDSAGQSTTTAMDSESIERLMALGYITGLSSSNSSDIDPRDVIDIIPLTWKARQKIGTFVCTDSV